MSKHKKVSSKTCVKRPLSKGQKIGLQDALSLHAGQKYTFNLQLATICHEDLFFFLFLSGCFTQVLLYSEQPTILEPSSYYKICGAFIYWRSMNVFSHLPPMHRLDKIGLCYGICIKTYFVSCFSVWLT